MLCAVAASRASGEHLCWSQREVAEFSRPGLNKNLEVGVAQRFTSVYLAHAKAP